MEPGLVEARDAEGAGHRLSRVRLSIVYRVRLAYAQLLLARENRFILEDQCYTCHTDYGFFGPVRAKLTGMRHLWNYETGRYTLPIRIRGPYRIANCLHCHGDSKVYREKHEDFRAQIASGDPGCLDCHLPAHPEDRGS